MRAPVAARNFKYFMGQKYDDLLKQGIADKDARLWAIATAAAQTLPSIRAAGADVRTRRPAIPTSARAAADVSAQGQSRTPRASAASAGGWLRGCSPAPG